MTLVPGHLPIAHRYTAGLAGERFFRALWERGIFLATHCPACGIVACPPAAFCPRCFAATDEEVEVGPGGRLESFTLVRRALDGSELGAPEAVGLVRLDGADTVLVHRLAPAGHPWAIGSAVEAVLADPADRKGGITDVAYFRPAGAP
ncbi:MAG TPA: Zn-ribbon domain-containing OB-fold protein [Actinomycetota bacterium]|nr:Zn-ribbon domain-containing OB-fold protein [Actinomycetota bacterium]